MNEVMCTRNISFNTEMEIGTLSLVVNVHFYFTELIKSIYITLSTYPLSEAPSSFRGRGRECDGTYSQFQLFGIKAAKTI